MSASEAQQPCRTVRRGDRTVGYNIVEPADEGDRSTAIVIFYALSGCSKVLSDMNFDGCRCSVLSVDRPLCGATSDVKVQEEPSKHPTDPSSTGGCCAPHHSSMSSSDSVILQRLTCHAEDVLKVLETEKIRNVYLLGICIGHPYAVQVCRHLQAPASNPSDVKLQGLTMVAPFVSTVCPHSWYMAKFGAWVPSSILYGGTEAISSVGSWLIPHIVGPSAIKKLITPEEEELAGWTEQDYQDSYQLLLDTTKDTERVKGIEARVGVSKIWQFEICDRFAEESGCGLVMEKDVKGKDDSGEQVASKPSPSNENSDSQIDMCVLECCYH